MAFGGALSFNGIDSTIAAGIATNLPPTPPSIFTAIASTEADCFGAPEPSVTFQFELPPVDINLNVLVNGHSMTVKNDGFGDLSVTGDLGLTLPECNPLGGFSVPDAASIGNVLVNEIKAAIPGVPHDIAPIVDAADMAMQTAQTNVILYW